MAENKPSTNFADKLKEDKAKADAARAEELKKATVNAANAEDKAAANAEAQAKIAAGEKQEGETEVVVTKDTDVPDSQKAGAILPGSTTVGADDAPIGKSDTAAESSTLSRNALDAPLGRGPSPQDKLPSVPADLSIDTAKAETGDFENANVRFFYSDRYGMSFGAGPKGDKRVTFTGRVLATADAEVIRYIEENYLDIGRQFRITEIDEDKYKEHRSHGDTVPTHVTLEDPRDVQDKIVLQPRTALTARKPRTEQDPRVHGLPEIGNAQQDHFTQGEKLIAEERPGTSTGNIQLQRNKAELDAVAGRTNPPPPAQRTGMTNSVNMNPAAKK